MAGVAGMLELGEGPGYQCAIADEGIRSGEGIYEVKPILIVRAEPILIVRAEFV